MFQTPTIRQLRDCAADLGMHPSDAYLESTQAIVGPLVDAYRQLESIPDDLPEVRYPRTPGYRPGREPARRVVRQDRDQGREARQARRQAGGDQG